MPVTMVAADAGCGKTTLIADFVRSELRHSIWYQLDYTDADPFVFLGYITHGIKKFVPEFGSTLLPYLFEATGELISFPERAVDLLLNEILENIEQPFILVLDDYHHIGQQTVVHKLVDRLLQYSSDMFHLIITTRDLPPVAFARRRTQSSGLIINRKELLFNDEEVSKLFQQTLNIDLNETEIFEYRERTHGWITALQIVRQVAEQEMHANPQNPKIDLRKILQKSEKDIFDYFAEEVFRHESQQTRELLQHLSLLNTLSLDICSGLYPENQCNSVLPELYEKNVFLTLVGDNLANEEYRFHPLFKEFLQRRLRSELGRDRMAIERSRIGDYFLKNNQWEQAISFYIEAENFEKAAQTIAEIGNEWIAAGAITSLGNFTDAIPAEFLEKYPHVLLHKAEISRLQGDAEKAGKILNRAVVLLEAQNDPPGEAEALHSLASIARRKGEISAAFEFLGKAEKLIGQSSKTYLRCANTRGLCLVAEGAWSQAEQQFRYALKLAEQQSDEHFIRLITHNVALPIGFRGDFGEALRWFRRIFREEKTTNPLPQEAIGHLNVARLLLLRGEFEETEKQLERSLEICRLYNLKDIRGEIFEAYGNFYRDKEDYLHASEFYARARKAYEDAGINPSDRELEDERARLFLMRGDAAKAGAIWENLLNARKSSANQADLFGIRLNIAKLRQAQDDHTGLSDELEKITAFYHEQNTCYEETMAAMALAQTYFSLGQRAEMMRHLQRSLHLVARYDYEFWLKGEIKRNPQMFSDKDVYEKLPLDLRDEIPQSKIRNIKPQQIVQPVIKVLNPDVSVVDLTVKTFGFVEIYRDKSKPFAPDAWTTRRARDIFCFIATANHRRVEKDVLIDTFWGADELAAIEKNFHPTISHVRKALNSRQSFKQNFLIFRDGAYQLGSEFTYSIDTEEFEAAVAKVENAKRAKDDKKFRKNLEVANSIYRGEFMSGVYNDWAEERRNYFSEQYTRVLNALAKLSFEEKSWSNTLKYANEILKQNQFREDAHRLILRVYGAQGKRQSIVEHFENLKKNLKSELGIAPAPETRKVVQKLLE